MLLYLTCHATTGPPKIVPPRPFMAATAGPPGPFMAATAGPPRTIYGSYSWSPGPLMAATASPPGPFAALHMVPPDQLWHCGWSPLPQLVPI